MQRPRRTSEFQDDPSVIKRQSRVQQRNTSASTPSGGNGLLAACSSGTAKKYSTRQSRIAVPSRPSSSDRNASINPYLAVPLSSVKHGVTPQKTPLPKTTANRALFTAEKQRTGQGVNTNSVPLHNDKKWVQEQMQRITEHLLTQKSLGGCTNTDFLSRGLRQMSIKQFVAIINYFLGYIWGNRYTVGNNHVEDIINILQKLRYPHALNKSWLKTPNTQHSFGNVIVLLDFLMDFVPPGKAEVINGMYFDLKQPEELGASKINEDFQIPDLEFQQELLENSERGFLLWDKQKKEEFDGLKLHTCNILIQKICGVADLESIELEIGKLQEILKSLQNERLPVDREMLKLKSKLSRELKCMRHDIKTFEDKCGALERDTKDLESRKMATAKEVSAVEMDIKLLQDKLNTQSCTIEQRDEMIADVAQHKQMLAIKQRVIQDLQNRYNNEQILHSKTIKQFNDQIESFNTHMREIKFCGLVKFDSSLNEENLELSLRPEQTEVDKLLPLLERIKKRALQSVHENKEKICNLQESCKQLTSGIDEKLLPKLNALRTSNTNNLQTLLCTLKQEVGSLQETAQRVEEDLVTAVKTIQELESVIKNKKSLTEKLVQDNEQIMQNAEQKHKKCLEQRKSYIKAYEEMLVECVQDDALQKLVEQVESQEKQLNELRKIFN